VCKIRPRPAGGTPPDYPIVTLCEAVTWLAWERYVAKVRVHSLYRLHRLQSSRRLALQGQLEIAGKRLGALVLDGKVVLRGWRQQSSDQPIEQPSAIPAHFVLDGAYLEGASDCLYSDILKEGNWAAGGIFPCYRHVRLDVRELHQAIDRAMPPVSALATPEPAAPLKPQSPVDQAANRRTRKRGRPPTWSPALEAEAQRRYSTGEFAKQAQSGTSLTDAAQSLLDWYSAHPDVVERRQALPDRGTVENRIRARYYGTQAGPRKKAQKVVPR
jgi:hypothetical protein